MSRTRRVPGFMHDNGLLLACLGLFAVFFVGMVLSGAATYNQEQQEHGLHEQVSVLTYLTTGDFVEATFENWESEFLQMGMYVVLTAFLYQKGSSESKPMNGPAPQDQDPSEVQPNQHTPWPVRKGGLVLVLYEHSLAIAFFVLFFVSWALHAIGGAKAFNDDQVQHGQAAISVWRYATTSQFWFESMQNWQSEFIAVAAIVGLSIFLRQRGSAESKPVAEAHRRTSA
ncbi:DUF6766 family protein [Mycobacterium sp. AZCC_0083]|uniref:DUF6766 family protein n=1 Tax=Mycobacterium sp. AZCC_0083 TaxID=2735882 RepID=UPI00161D6C18|nr:DUF6766 family protein [Mycobacterium sp. AZCC_0083]MBB5162473.1 hypothetical protein [Mycobacterium sp. AZCC_0083]